MNFSEQQFSTWAGPPSDSEKQRIINTESAVKKAIGASDALRNRSVRVYAQGSYRNRVNVRADSDVDVAVLYNGAFFHDGIANATLDALGYTDGAYNYSEFRTDVGNALRNYFKGGVVTEGNKAFDVKANTYRVEADVIPLFEFRHYWGDDTWETGVALFPKTGSRIVNWHEQHYQNGVAKNAATNRSFKGLVRIIKTLRYRMLADGIASAKAAPSFMLESLIYNLPDEGVSFNQWIDEFRSALATIYHATLNIESCDKWVEVNELKWLFHGQPWTHADANAFVLDCWNYVGYE